MEALKKNKQTNKLNIMYWFSLSVNHTLATNQPRLVECTGLAIIHTLEITYNYSCTYINCDIS